MSNKRDFLIIAIDFDNTIVNTVYNEETRLTEIRGLKDGAKEYINKLHNDGHYIIIWTCRENENQCIAEKFLIDNGIYYDRINANHTEWFYNKKHDSRKVFADVYIDDAGILGLPPTWKDIYNIVNNKFKNNFKPNDTKEA